MPEEVKKIVLPIGNEGKENTVITPTEGDKTNITTDLVIGKDTFKVNTEGNAIDDKGVVIKTKVELEQLKTIAAQPVVTNEESVIILDAENKEITYKLDKDGNALNSDGSIFKTKSERSTLDEVPVTSDDELSIEELQKLTGVTPMDNNGVPLVYENTKEGLTKYTLDTATILGEQYAKDEQNKLIQAYPILQDVINHLVINNGNLEGFNKQTSYDSIVLDKNNKDQLGYIIIEERLAKGDSKEQANTYLNYLTADNKLFEGAIAAKDYLVGKETELRTRQQKQLDDIRLRDLDTEKQYWLSVKAKLDSGKLNIGNKTYTIPKTIKIIENGKPVMKSSNDYMDYISKPLIYNIDGVNNTMTHNQYDLYMEKINLVKTGQNIDNDMFDSYRRFTKGDLTQFIEEQILNSEVKKIRVLKSQTSNSARPNVNTNTGKILLPVK
jgi:hypothetical protein